METMSKIVEIHRSPSATQPNSLMEDPDNPLQIGPRQLAIQAGKITIIVEFVHLVLDSRQGLKNRELKNFMHKFDSLERHELLEALQVPEEEFMRILNQVVECIGCRRIIERVFQQFKKHDSRTLDPIMITKEGVVRIRQEHLDGSLDVCKLLQKSVFLFADLLTFKQRSKQSIRCTIHNLDAYKVTPFSETWTQIWTSMKGPCREKILIIDMEDLQTVLDVYLKKHKFCQECSAKVETAFRLLFKEKNPKKEPGYSEELYAGIKRCLNKHIQLPCKVDFIDMLIRRAEPELLNGNRQRERHAKTLEIAQEEVLTCIGMCIFERFRRIYNCRKEEEVACQLLAILALHGMYQSFDLAVERKRGISNLELLYEEISQQQQRQVQKKEQKRLKKRQKKMEKRSFCSNCKTNHSHNQSHDQDVGDVEEEEEESAKHHSEQCGSKKAKRKSRCDSENDIIEEEDVDLDEEEEDDEYEEEEPSVQEIIEMRKSSSKSNQKQNSNNNNGATKKGKATTTKQLKRTGKDNQSATIVVERKENIRAPPATEHVCNTCDGSSGKRPLKSQPISVDCGYVSDQLSLTNCSSTSSLEDSSKGGVGRGRGVPNKSPIRNVPCSSPLTINSQLSSLTSSPEGSEVACQDGLCNHNGCEVVASGGVLNEHSELVSATAATPSSGSSAVASYIPEELINDFHLKHRNLKEVREELRRNLRQNFAQFCLKNKNRSLSHLQCE